jgi:carboxypeptidase C (cathepsin A)
MVRGQQQHRQQRLLTVLFTVLFYLVIASSASFHTHRRRQDPAEPSNVKTISTASGRQIRYKEPGKAGVCETTPGVNSYSGYIDVSQDSHSFFWFFEARKNPATAPITLWINGGPGSDSLIGLFQELGPCSVLPNLTTTLNPYSWTEHSNVLFLSQPLGVGFSYRKEGLGSIDAYSGTFVSAEDGGGNSGRFPTSEGVEKLPNTQATAEAAWDVIQTFYTMLPQLDSKVKSKEFHLWTESYGGHYGPVFFKYFERQNALLLKNNSTTGVHLNLATLGIGNGIIDEYVQASSFPDFAMNNTYGIKAVNETVYNYMKFALTMANGCLDQISYCRYSNHSTVAGQQVCVEASNMCRDSVESPYYQYSGRGTYDIRHPSNDSTPPSYFVAFLNQPHIQEALGVNINYTADASSDVFFAFARTGDFVYRDFIRDIRILLDAGVRIHLYYGDADYICNWFGGEAVSLALNYTTASGAEFERAGYEPLRVDGTEFGVVRQKGRLSFARIYDAGHEVPFYQPKAAQEMFRRVIQGYDVATGMLPLAADSAYGSQGDAQATHTEPFVPLPTATGSATDAKKGDAKFGNATIGVIGEDSRGPNGTLISGNLTKPNDGGDNSTAKDRPNRAGYARLHRARPDKNIRFSV